MDYQFYNYNIKGMAQAKCERVLVEKQMKLPEHGWQFKFALPGPYKTELPPGVEATFALWVHEHQIPFDDGPSSDYDMRGYFLKFVLVGRDGTMLGRHDGRQHFPDIYKTPFHKSFSRESKYALKSAPSWNAQDQLIGADGRIYWDEKVATASQIFSSEAP